MRAWLRMWQANDAQLQPVLGTSEITAELAPVSQMLKQVAGVGLEAMQYANGGAPAGWKEAQLATLKAAQEPQAVLILPIVPALQRLVEAVQQ